MSKNVRSSAVAREAALFPVSTVTVNDGQLSFLQEIAASVERLTVHFGLKTLVDYFDGRHGEPVAKSTLSRWGSEPTRCPAWAIPVLVELDPVFRGVVMQHVTARMVADGAIDAEVMKRDPKAAQVLADARAAIAQAAMFPGLAPRGFRS